MWEKSNLNLPVWHGSSNPQFFLKTKMFLFPTFSKLISKFLWPFHNLWTLFFPTKEALHNQTEAIKLCFLITGVYISNVTWFQIIVAITSEDTNWPFKPVCCSEEPHCVQMDLAQPKLKWERKFNSWAAYYVPDQTLYTIFDWKIFNSIILNVTKIKLCSKITRTRRLC